MAERIVKIGGQPYRAEAIDASDLHTGAILRHEYARCTRRLVAFDGNDAILRGLRGEPIEAVPIEKIADSWLICHHAAQA